MDRIREEMNTHLITQTYIFRTWDKATTHILRM